MVAAFRLTRRALLAAAPACAFAGRAALAGASPAPARIASLDWPAVEALLAINVVPTAVCDAAFYRQPGFSPHLPDSVIDAGSYSEPNLELLQQVAPDIIIRAGWQAAHAAVLDEIAPPVICDVYRDNRQPLRNAEDMVTQLASLTLRQAEGLAFLSDINAGFGRMKAALSGIKTPFYIADLDTDGRSAWIFGPNSLLHDMLLRMGLSNAWTDAQNFWGMSSVSVERLAAVPDAALVYLDAGARTRRVLDRLAHSPLWLDLPFVRGNRIYALPGVYANGGIQSVLWAAQSLTAALGAKPL